LDSIGRHFSLSRAAFVRPEEHNTENHMNISTFGRGALACLLLTGSAAAMAQSPNYNYIEAGYGYLDLDGFANSDNGYWAGFSAQFAEPFYVTGSFQRFEFDTFRSSEDFDLINLNVGFRAALSSSSDFNFEIGYDDADFADASSDGYRATLGFRARTTRDFQSRLYAGYSGDDSFSNGQFIGGAEGTLWLNERIAAVLQFETYEFDFNIARAGFRLTF
jgi:hypothetical protein